KPTRTQPEALGKTPGRKPWYHGCTDPVTGTVRGTRSPATSRLGESAVVQVRARRVRRGPAGHTTQPQGKKYTTSGSVVGTHGSLLGGGRVMPFPTPCSAAGSTEQDREAERQESRGL